jgi:hypothetical protein
MGYVCEACGETFDTLTGLRLHDCESKPVAAPGPQADFYRVTRRGPHKDGIAKPNVTGSRSRPWEG